MAIDLRRMTSMEAMMQVQTSGRRRLLVVTGHRSQSVDVRLKR